jgi:hypothetical protein
MPWAYILQILGPGSHWGRTKDELLAAIRRAESDGKPNAAEHLRIILEMRNCVMADDQEKEPRS